MSSGVINVPYVPVRARVARNDNNPNGSSITSGGEATGGFWIHWNSDSGFVGKGWLFDATDNYILTGWANSGLSTTYGEGEVGFEKYMTTNPGNLDSILGGWDPLSKNRFVTSQANFLGVYGGVYGSNDGGKCIEYLG